MHLGCLGGQGIGVLRVVVPAETQFAGFGNIFILPDQAAVNAQYNPTNKIQSTVSKSGKISTGRPTVARTSESEMSPASGTPADRLSAYASKTKMWP